MIHHSFLNYQSQVQQVHLRHTQLETKTSPPPTNDIELFMSVLYNTFLLRLQKQSLSAETLSAMKQFASFLASCPKDIRKNKQASWIWTTSARAQNRTFFYRTRRNDSRLLFGRGLQPRVWAASCPNGPKAASLLRQHATDTKRHQPPATPACP